MTNTTNCYSKSNEVDKTPSYGQLNEYSVGSPTPVTIVVGGTFYPWLSAQDTAHRLESGGDTDADNVTGYKFGYSSASKWEFCIVLKECTKRLRTVYFNAVKQDTGLYLIVDGSRQGTRIRDIISTLTIRTNCYACINSDIYSTGITA